MRLLERVNEMLRVTLQGGLRVAAFQSRVDAGPSARSSIARLVTQLLMSFTFVRRLDDRLEDIVRPNGMPDWSSSQPPMTKPGHRCDPADSRETFAHTRMGTSISFDF